MDNPILSVKSILLDRLDLSHERYLEWLQDPDFQTLLKYRASIYTSGGAKADTAEVLSLCYLELANRDIPFTRQADVYKFILDMLPIKVYDVIESSNRELS